MTSKLRLLAFCDYFGSDSSGGSERAAQEIYKRLASQGHEVTVMSALPSSATAVPVAGVDVLERRGWPLSRLTGAQVLFAPSVFRNLEATVHRARPELLHANNLYFQSTLAAALVSKSRRIPLITTAHVGGMDAMPRLQRTLANVYLSTAVRFVLRRSAHFIAVAPSVTDHLAHLGIPPTRISLVPNGVDHSRFHPADQALSGDTLRVGFVGRLIQNKGPMVLAPALAQLENWSVPFTATFVGDGPLRTHLATIIRDSRISHRVDLVGETDDVPDRLRKMDVLVRPSQTEGLSLAILEAMASGVCVVASDIPGNRDAVRNNVTGVLFPPGDEAALARELRALAADPIRRRRLADAGRDHVADLSWEHTARSTFGVFEGVLDRTRHAH